MVARRFSFTYFTDDVKQTAREHAPEKRAKNAPVDVVSITPSLFCTRISCVLLPSFVEAAAAASASLCGVHSEKSSTVSRTTTGRRSFMCHLNSRKYFSNRG